MTDRQGFYKGIDIVLTHDMEIQPPEFGTYLPVEFVKKDPLAIIPEKQTPGSAGADVCSIERKTFLQNGRCLVKTGLVCRIPEGFTLMVCSRSGLAQKGLIVANQPGIIDSDYRGEIGVLLWNISDQVIEINPGDRIAQLLLVPVPNWTPEVKESLDSTQRGQGGFGSTGL